MWIFSLKHKNDRTVQVRKRNCTEQTKISNIFGEMKTQRRLRHKQDTTNVWHKLKTFAGSHVILPWTIFLDRILTCIVPSYFYNHVVHVQQNVRQISLTLSCKYWQYTRHTIPILNTNICRKPQNAQLESDFKTRTDNFMRSTNLPGLEPVHSALLFLKVAPGGQCFLALFAKAKLASSKQDEFQNSEQSQQVQNAVLVSAHKLVTHFSHSCKMLK